MFLRIGFSCRDRTCQRTRIKWECCADNSPNKTSQNAEPTNYRAKQNIRKMKYEDPKTTQPKFPKQNTTTAPPRPAQVPKQPPTPPPNRHCGFCNVVIIRAAYWFMQSCFAFHISMCHVPKPAHTRRSRSLYKSTKHVADLLSNILLFTVPRTPRLGLQLRWNILRLPRNEFLLNTHTTPQEHGTAFFSFFVLFTFETLSREATVAFTSAWIIAHRFGK